MSIPALKSLSGERSAHYYRHDGSPVYEVPGKNGRMRPPTVADAREQELVPGVSEILSLWPRPGLEIYKRQQDLLAALTLPRLDGETDDAFCKRVIEDSATHAKKAADFGSDIHRLFEACLREKTGTIPIQVPLQPILPWAPYIIEWLDKNVRHVLFTEKTVVGPGYGGRIDAGVLLTDGRLALLDIKTQGLKDDKCNFYDTWAMQLIAYEECDPWTDLNWGTTPTDKVQVSYQEEPTHLSVVLDSFKPSAPLVKEWTHDEMNSAFLDFMACFELWQRVKQYDPT